MKEILIEIEDNQVEELLKDLTKYKIKSVDEVITFDEAKKRVAEAVEEYRSGRMKTYNEKEFDEIMEKYWEKYEN
jgi:ribonuclease HIII